MRNYLLFTAVRLCARLDDYGTLVTALVKAPALKTAGICVYSAALGGVDAVAAPILSSVCVVSLLLSRIFLKEKLNWKTYAFITVVIVGILLLAVAEEL
mgnify:CR=1 FL=1